MSAPRAWPFSGAIMPGYPALHPLTEDFWPRFWKIFQTTRQPEASERKLPWRSTRPMPEQVPR